MESKILIEDDKIVFVDSSVDESGRVFFYNSRVFRAITPEYEGRFIELLGSSLFAELIDKHLIPRTWISEYRLGRSNLVLEHERIDTSKPHHWSFSMYKEAALHVLDLNALCNLHGYELKDGHPYNIYFFNNAPIFIDVGSIIKEKSRNKWVAYDEFINYFYVQVAVWSGGDHFVARKLIESGNDALIRTIPMNTFEKSHFAKAICSQAYKYRLRIRKGVILSTSRELPSLQYVVKRINNFVGYILHRRVGFMRYERTAFSLSRLRHSLSLFSSPAKESVWKDYQKRYFGDDSIEITDRFRKIIALVIQHAPNIESAVELAGNRGVFLCNLLRHVSLKRAILTDYDESVIDFSYKYFQKNRIGIQPYLYNFMRPLLKEESEYIKADIVFALAITHHLILTQSFDLSTILRVICRHSKQFVVIEFMPLGLWSGGDTLSVPKWYTLEWFKKELQRYLSIVAEENVERNRIVFIGEIKKASA